MSHLAFIRIWCDWPDCHAVIDTRRSKLPDAREDAKKQGWKIVPGIIDLCGDEAGRKDGLDHGRWNGHATHTDHSPIAKPAKRIGGRAAVLLSCSCTWVYESPYDWQPAGVVARDMVSFYWAKHVKELPPATTNGPSPRKDI